MSASERRRSERRQEDHGLAGAVAPDPRDALIALLRDAIRLLRRAALGLALAWALLATIGCVALLSQSSHNASALSRATSALSTANADHLQVVASLGQSQAANANSVSTRQLETVIQQSRLQACNDQNVQHRQTLHALGELFATGNDRIHTPAQRAAARRTERAVELVFDASTPHRDCAKVVGPP